MNKQAKVVTIAISLLFFFMIGYYVHFIIVDSTEIVSNNGNELTDTKNNNLLRGTIYSKNGKTLAYTDDNGTADNLDDDERVYPYGKTFAHAIGITTHGKSGIEKFCNYDLLNNEAKPLQKIIDDFQGKKEKGSDVYTTFNVGLQKAAYNAISTPKGAAFVMDVDTGAVLAMVSKPSYNPQTIDKIWDDLANDSSDSRLVNRATQGKYIPGSTFKILTTLEYIKEFKKYNNFSYTCYGSAKFGGFKINCFDHRAHYSEDLTDAFANSCNSAFSKIGTKLDIGKFKDTANHLMFNEKLPIDLESSVSNFVLNSKSKEFDIAQTAIGQGETTISPAHMAMIAAAIANKGVLMKPYFVDSVINSYDEIVKSAEPEAYRTLMSPKEAKQLKKYMRAVCTQGTATALAYTDYTAYGKTGTAELDKKGSDGKINSWFVGFAKKGKKKIAIGVCLDDIRQGSANATTSAKQIFDAYFE